MYLLLAGVGEKAWSYGIKYKIATINIGSIWDQGGCDHIPPLAWRFGCGTRTISIGEYYQVEKVTLTCVF
jgi:hypothetical protein